MTDPIKRSPTTEWAYELAVRFAPQCVPYWNCLQQSEKDAWIIKIAEEILRANPFQPKWDIRNQEIIMANYMISCIQVATIYHDLYWGIRTGEELIDGNADSLDAAMFAVEEAVMGRLKR